MGTHGFDLKGKLAKAGRLAREQPIQAILIHYEILARYPRNPRTLGALAGLARTALPGILEVTNKLARAGAAQQALVVVETLARGDPENPRVTAAIARYLLGLERYAEALERVEAALPSAPDSLYLLHMKGAALQRLGDSAEAVALLERVVAARPGVSDAENWLGVARMSLGDKQGAIAALRAAVATPVGRADAWQNLSGLVNFAEEPALFAELQRYAAQPEMEEADREVLAFALAKAADDRGEVDMAFAAMVRGNAGRKRTRRRTGPGIVDQDERLLAWLESTFDARRPGGVAFDATPLLVVGMPRSGTTLVEQILGAHPAATAGGELTALGAAVTAELACARPLSGDGVVARYRQATAGLAAEGAALVDKMPMNFKFIGFVLAACPAARVVHVRRDPIATCFSNFKLRFTSEGMAFTDELGTLVAYYKMYQRYMAFWRARFGERILDLDYEVLTERQEGQTRRLLEFAGLDWDPACLRFHSTPSSVNTASVVQVRRAMYRGSSEAWRAYAAHLGPLLDGLQTETAAHAARVEAQIETGESNAELPAAVRAAEG